jgi:squalene-hopene/tetraprenyl-beta-curcumene cyclase
MKTTSVAFFCIPTALSLVLTPVQARSAESPASLPPANTQVREPVRRAVDRGIAWLLARQNTNGWWSSADHPALTALALSAIMGEPTGRFRSNPPPAVAKGYAFLLSSARPDGSIHRGTLANYNTAISLVALAQANSTDYDDVIRRGRAFVVRSQNDLGEPGKTDTPLDGGVGYADKYAHSDLNNTLTALEAIRATQHLVSDKQTSTAPDLNWNAAIHFIESCQNLPSHNKQDWVSDDPKDRGGFVYYPGVSMAGGVTNATTGRVALRSYGSISYAGLLSYLYADFSRDDVRVRAVLDWLRDNYTLDENPGMGAQGLFYYLHLMTKALTAAHINTLEVADGRHADWRIEVARRLLDLQKSDGSWANTNNRWWEKDPCLVTAYVLLSLETIWRNLPSE